MRMGIIQCENVVIANGQTSSNTVSAALVYEDAMTIGLQAPATLPETVTIYVSQDGTNWNALYDGSTTVLAPLATYAASYPVFPWKYFKLVAGGAVAAERIFKMSKSVLGD